MSKKKNKNRTNSFGSCINLIDSFDKLRKVHKNIPNFDFDCKNCEKNCCVSPYISVVEFLYVAGYIIRVYEEPYKVLLKNNGRNSEGFKICPFLDENRRCLIYNVRHYKCRMTGMDILDDFFTEVCIHKQELGLSSPKITKKEWIEWVTVLTKINKPLNYSEQLFFDDWLTFYFKNDDELSKNEIKVRNFLKDYLHLEDYIPNATAEDLI